MFKAKTVSPTAECPRRPKIFKTWTDEAMKLAVAAVNEGMSVRRASYEFDVPKSTLQDRLSGKVGVDARSGPERYLTDDEEKKLVKFLIGCSKVGYSRSKKQVLVLVSAIVAKKRGLEEGDVSVTKGWWASFQKRHPQLTLRGAEALSYARAVAEDPEILSSYYDTLEKVLRDNDLLDKPHIIYNCDETGFSFEHKPSKVVGMKGVKHLNATTSGDKAQLTVLACVSASGYPLPPMIIFDRKKLKPDHTKGEIPSTIYGLSSNGWIDGDLFEDWFMQHFLTHIPAIRPVLLLLDGHSSHYRPSLLRKAGEEDVIIFCLPPHTTHLLQPLDKTCFSPLKAYWNEECQKYMTSNPGHVINRFNEVFSRAWKKAMVPSTISSGFKVTGVYPFSRLAVELAVDKKSESSTAPTTAAYIPFCSPAIKRLRTNVSESTVAKSYTWDFSDDEIRRFQRRYQEGFNIPGDEKWLSVFHTESWDNDNSVPKHFPQSSNSPPSSHQISVHGHPPISCYQGTKKDEDHRMHPTYYSSEPPGSIPYVPYSYGPYSHTWYPPWHPYTYRTSESEAEKELQPCSQLQSSSASDMYFKPWVPVNATSYMHPRQSQFLEESCRRPRPQFCINSPKSAASDDELITSEDDEGCPRGKLFSDESSPEPLQLSATDESSTVPVMTATSMERSDSRTQDLSHTSSVLLANEKSHDVIRVSVASSREFIS